MKSLDITFMPANAVGIALYLGLLLRAGRESKRRFWWLVTAAGRVATCNRYRLSPSLIGKPLLERRLLQSDRLFGDGLIASGAFYREPCRPGEEYAAFASADEYDWSVHKFIDYRNAWRTDGYGSVKAATVIHRLDGEAA